MRMLGFVRFVIGMYVNDKILTNPVEVGERYCEIGIGNKDTQKHPSQHRNPPVSQHSSLFFRIAKVILFYVIFAIAKNYKP